MIGMTVPQMRRFECTVNGTVCYLAPSLTKFLSLLLVSDPDTFVARQDIIDHVWPDDPPLTADKMVAIYVYKLRRLGIHVERRTSAHRRENGHFFNYYGGYRIPKGERQ